MTTVVVDLAAVTLDATELALAITRGTSGPHLKAVALQSIIDAYEALENLKGPSSTNTAAIAAIQAKLK